MTGTRIYIAHSRSLHCDAQHYATQLELQGYDVILPSRFRDGEGELQIVRRCLCLIKSAHEVHILYDGNSQGAAVELGAALAWDKPITVVKLNPACAAGLLEELSNDTAGR